MPGLFALTGADPLRDEPVRGLLAPTASDQVRFGLLSDNPMGEQGSDLSAGLGPLGPLPVGGRLAGVTRAFDRTRDLPTDIPDSFPGARGRTGNRQRDATLRMEPVPKERGRPLKDCKVIANQIRSTRAELEVALASVSGAVDMFLPEMRPKLVALEQKRDSTRDPAMRRALEAEIAKLKESIKDMLDGLDEAADKATEARNRLIALFSDHEDNNCP